MRHRPARLAADKAEFFLQRQAIDFIDHTINIKRQAVALRRDRRIKSDKTGCPLHRLRQIANRQAPSFNSLQQAVLRGKSGDFIAPISGDKFTQAIGEKAQWPLRSNAAI